MSDNSTKDLDEILPLDNRASKHIQGDPNWFILFLEIMGLLGSFASVIGLLMYLHDRKPNKNKEDVDKCQNPTENLQFLLARYREGSRSLLNLIKDTSVNFEDLIVQAVKMYLTIDKYRYQIYLNLKRELQDIRKSVDQVLEEYELIAVESGIDLPNDDRNKALMGKLDEILGKWGESNFCDVASKIKNFNQELKNALDELQNSFEHRQDSKM